jgi:cyclopropane fatty-acyl-phospholipid synthase-like methyltransferase
LANSVIGSHLAHDPALGRVSRILARAIGTPEIGLRVRTLHVVRAAEAEGGRNVLDAGCGAGFIALTLASRNPDLHIVGADVNAAQVDRARAIATANGMSNASFVTSLDDAALDHFDVVLCIDTIEYVSDPAPFVDAIHARLAPGGALLLHCRRTPTPRVLERFRRLDPLSDGRLRAGYDEAGIIDLVARSGLVVESVEETMRLTAELGFELTHPDHGLVRSRAGRYALLPALAPLGRLDMGGHGAGLLVTARRPL